MKIVKPDPTMFLLPEGTRSVVYAENQPEYLALPSLVTPDGRVISTWMPEPNDLALIANGVPIILVLHTFNQPLQPIIITVGGLDLRDQGEQNMSYRQDEQIEQQKQEAKRRAEQETQDKAGYKGDSNQFNYQGPSNDPTGYSVDTDPADACHCPECNQNFNIEDDPTYPNPWQAIIDKIHSYELDIEESQQRIIEYDALLQSMDPEMDYDAAMALERLLLNETDY